MFFRMKGLSSDLMFPPSSNLWNLSLQLQRVKLWNGVKPYFSCHSPNLTGTFLGLAEFLLMSPPTILFPRVAASLSTGKNSKPFPYDGSSQSVIWELGESMRAFQEICWSKLFLSICSNIIYLFSSCSIIVSSGVFWQLRGHMILQLAG